MALYFGQAASFSQVARLLIVAERCARDLVARDPLGKGGVVDLAGVFKFALTAINKLFVSAESKLECFDCGIFGISQLRAMPQSLSLLAKPDERLEGLSSAFHLYHNRPIDNTEKIRNRTRCERDKQYCARPSPFRFASLPRAAGRSESLCDNFTPRTCLGMAARTRPGSALSQISWTRWRL